MSTKVMLKVIIEVITETIQIQTSVLNKVLSNALEKLIAYKLLILQSSEKEMKNWTLFNDENRTLAKV